MKEGNEFPSIIESLQEFTALMVAFAKFDARYVFYFCAMDERCRKYFRVTIGDKHYEWIFVPYTIPNLAEDLVPITDLIGNEKLNWSEKCENAYLKICQKIENRILLQYPNWNDEFIIKTDASDYGSGEIFQYDDSGNKRIIGFVSFKFKGPFQTEWSVPKKELWSAINCVEKFDFFVHGRPFSLLMDAQAIALMSKTDQRKIEK
jgi:hypothetical protein